MESVESVETESLPRKWIQDPRRLLRNGAIIAAASLVLSFGVTRILGWAVGLPEGVSVSKPVLEGQKTDSTGGAEPVASASQKPTRADQEPTVAPPKKFFVDPILKRNIFDSTAVGLAAQAAADPSGAERRTDMRVTLLATVVAVPEEYSSALILSEEGKGMANGYGIGDSLLGEATVFKIQQKKVYIKRSDGTVEYLDMGGEAGKQPIPAGAKIATAQGEENTEGVTKTGENSYIVDNSLIAEALGNLDQLATQVRAIPHRGTDGQIDGYRLSAIRRGSLLSKLGVKNGDVIAGVNGMSLTNPNDAMSALQQLQGGGSKSFSFDVTRRNQKQTLQYEIR